MRFRRKLPIFGGVLLVVLAVAAVVVLRKHAPPEPARLLPGADGFVYLDLKWIRRADMTGQLPPVSHDPEYEQFIQQTGFQFERDLDQVAVAMHYPESLPRDSASARETRYSEVFVGKFDGAKMRAYLQKLSSSVDVYQSTNIYNIPLQGRTLRVALLSVDTVAASNHPDPQVIQGMIDRSRKLASPFGGPSLLRKYYKQVPLASLAWTIFKAEPAMESPGASEFSFLFDKPAVVVASARYLGSVHLRAVAFTDNDADAKNLSEKVNTFLTLFRSAELSVPEQGSDADIKKFFQSLAVSQHDSRAVLTAVVPPGFVRKAFAEPPSESLPSLPAPQQPQPQKTTKKKHHEE